MQTFKYVNLFDVIDETTVRVYRVRDDLVSDFASSQGHEKARFSHGVITITVNKSLDRDPLQEIERFFGNSNE